MRSFNRETYPEVWLGREVRRGIGLSESSMFSWGVEGCVKGWSGKRRRSGENLLERGNSMDKIMVPSEN